MEGSEREGTQGVDAPGIARVLGFAIALGALGRDEAAREETRAKGLAFKAFEGSKAAIPYVDQTAR
jgi:hypothetical protein